MKLIVAIIRPEKLEEVARTLDKPGVSLVCFGRAIDTRDSPAKLYRGHRVPDPPPRLRLEIVVTSDGLVRETIGAIARAASADDSWRLGSGHVLVIPLDDSAPIPAARGS